MFSKVMGESNPQAGIRASARVRPAESARPQEEASMASKRYQCGTLKQLKCGEWVLQWRKDVLSEDGDNRRRSEKTRIGLHDSKRLARRAADEFLETVNSREYRPGKVITLAEFSVRWKRDALSLEEEGSQKAAKSHLKCWLVPMLGKEKLENIHQQLVQAMVATLAQKTDKREALGQKTILNVLGTLGSMMRCARDWGYTVGGFDRKRLTLPRADLRNERMFTESETIRLINAADGKYKAMFCIAAMTGMRCGEVLGLRWSDIDFDGLAITIQQQCWNGRLKVLKSKRGRRRENTVPIPTPLAEMLRWYESAWKPNALDLLFASPQGKPLWANSVLRHTLHPLTLKLEIPAGGFHAFRHQMASLMVSSGANPKVTQAQLGHSQIGTTMNVYARVLHDDHREAIEKVSLSLRPTIPTRKELVN